jgi:hypothetical protein
LSQFHPGKLNGPELLLILLDDVTMRGGGTGRKQIQKGRGCGKKERRKEKAEKIKFVERLSSREEEVVHTNK